MKSVQSLKRITLQQRRRVRVLLRAFRAANVEDRYRAVRAICTRLPLTKAARRRLWSWCLTHVIAPEQCLLLLDAQAAQKDWEERGRARLHELLREGEQLSCLAARDPTVSFVLVLHNKAHLSVLSIESILQNAGVPYELIIVDNGSTDETGRLLEKIPGAKVIRNQSNLGFGPACMQAAACAEGEYLCFLNNDALLSPGAMTAVLQNFRNSEVAAVGGKILLATGALQEAGSLVWSDGSALGYGRGEDPNAPQYNFRRPVDYCSAVFLVTRRRLFAEVGGFRPEFAPAYYEDTDYCMTLWQKGWQVIYEPQAVIRHYESASSGGNEFATARMAELQETFFQKWRQVLQRHYAPASSNLCAARIAVQSPGLRVLYLDDRVPHRDLGSGFPRSNNIVCQLVALGHHVTCATLTSPLLGNEYYDIPREVEILDGLCHRERLVKEYLTSSDVVWVSRPHNMNELLKQVMSNAGCRRFRLVYDAEAIFSERTQQRRELNIVPERMAEPHDEIALAKSADMVVVVSEADRAKMLQGGVRSVYVVGHRLSADPTSTSFSERSTFLFVGAVHGTDNPNYDSIRYFCGSVWPTVAKATGAKFTVAGYGTDEVLGDLDGPNVRVLGAQQDLRPVYQRARVFVVPTRYAAGLPFKAHEAAAYGVPLIVSGVIAAQLQWRNGIDYLVAEDADAFVKQCSRLWVDQELWETLRANALQRVIDELSPAAFERSIRSVLNEVVSAP